MPAGGANYRVNSGRFDELEAVAEGTALARGGVCYYFPKGQLEFQLHQFAQRNFNPQYGRHSRFADIQRMAFDRATGAGVDGDIDLHFETGLAARVRQDFGGSCSGGVF